jgi:hypothetical protein
MSNRKKPRRGKGPQPIQRTTISRANKANNRTHKKSGKRPRGRPPLGAEYVNTRIPKDMLAAIDAWRAKQPGKPKPVRPEAVRRLIAIALHPAEPHPPKPRTARTRWDDYRPTPHQLQVIDTYRNMVRPAALTRAEAISLLVDTALRHIAAPERKHAEGDLGDWTATAEMPADASKRPTGTSDAKDAPKAQDEPNEPPRPPRPPKND